MAFSQSISRRAGHRFCHMTMNFTMTMGLQGGQMLERRGQGWSRLVKVGFSRFAGVGDGGRGEKRGRKCFGISEIKVNQSKSKLRRVAEMAGLPPAPAIRKRRSSGALQERERLARGGSTGGENRARKWLGVRLVKADKGGSRLLVCQRIPATPAGVGGVKEIGSGGVAPSSLNPRLHAVNPSGSGSSVSSRSVMNFRRGLSNSESGLTV